MASDQQYFSLLGLSPTAPREQVEDRYQELVAFLSSAEIPDHLRSWANQQTEAVDDAYAAILDPTRQDEKRSATVQAETTQPAVARKSPAAKSGSGFRGLIHSRAFMAVAVLALVAGSVVIARMDRTDSTAAPASTAAQDPNAPVPLDAALVSQWMAAIQANPSDKTALFNLGEAYFQAQQWQTSIDWFTKLKAADPTNVHALADIGTSNFNLGRFDAAKASWEAGLASAPNDPQLHYNLGFLAANTEPPDYAAARKQWQAVIDVAPDSDLAKTVKVHMTSLPSQ